jgi:N-methylhydantoinase A
VSARLLAETLAIPNVIATDVGGTTFKVSLIADVAWSFAREAVVNQYSLAIPMLDLVSIGAGGGSIARVEGARLLVGPQSAGADPGPACYGHGGDEPTVTDADLVLGFVNPDYFLGGRITLDRARAERAIRERIADPLFDGDVVRAAAGIRAVVDAQMADLVRKATIERGHDPRDFVLLAFGGAGPLHAASYGRDIGVSRLIVPLTATVFSAFGATAADVLHSFTTASLQLLPGDPSLPRAHFEALESQAWTLLRQEGVADDAVHLARWAEVRYRRQVHQVRVPVGSGPIVESTLQSLMEAFERRYEALHGRGTAYCEAGIELVSVGIDATGRMPKPRLTPRPAGEAPATPTIRGSRHVFWVERGGFVPTTVYDGGSIAAGQRFDGPALIELPGTTVAIPPGDRAEIDAYLNVVIELGGGDA